ncbi:hypothetical protein BKA62DRAFT_702103 [Auriculariales sp. MPI-PUGE-AT-0066]|nr:hypothetical protein BKA62DRAFT_702103 [Auriculariales sp. MPI-PUGE-AT-0066]
MKRIRGRRKDPADDSVIETEGAPGAPPQHSKVMATIQRALRRKRNVHGTEDGVPVAPRQRSGRIMNFLRGALPMIKSAVEDVPVPGPKAFISVANDFVRRSEIKRENVHVQESLVHHIDSNIATLNDALGQLGRSETSRTAIQNSLSELSVSRSAVNAMHGVDSRLMAEVARDDLAVEAGKLSRQHATIQTGLIVSLQASNDKLSSEVLEIRSQLRVMAQANIQDRELDRRERKSQIMFIIGFFVVLRRGRPSHSPKYLCLPRSGTLLSIDIALALFPARAFFTL